MRRARASATRWADRDLIARGLTETLVITMLAPRARRVSQVPTEHEEQRALMEWVTLMSGRYPQLQYLAAVPNGGHRHPAVAGKLRAEGVRAGYPDLLLDSARGGFHGLRIELKRRKGGRVSREQQWWLDRLTALGYCTRVCRGASEAKDVLLWYLGLPATRTR